MLKNPDQAHIFDHDGKADILWKAFKERMGCADSPQMCFNLSDSFGIGMDSDTRDSLEVPFSDKEIEEVVKDLPNEKSPGPDGFNNEFIKSCWSVIANE